MVRPGNRLLKNIGVVYLIVFLLCILVANTLACSEVFIDKGGMVKVSARNFDFNNAGDGFIRFSPVGTSGQAQYTPLNCQPLKWTSKYASITFNLSLVKSQSPKDGEYGAGVDGINQAGLKVGTYFLASSVFPEEVVRTTVDVGSLMQYLLDNCKSVDEAIADLSSGRYRVTSTPTGVVEIKLHLFLHDVHGVSAIVEFIDGKIKVTYNPVNPVLTNNTYGQSIEYLKQYAGFGGELAVPGSVDSLDRFVRGVYYWKNLQIPKNSLQAVNYGFATIQILAESPGFLHGCTLWTIVTDLDNRKIYFRTLNNPTIACIDLNKLSATVKTSHSINILRTDLTGNINDMFQQD